MSGRLIDVTASAYQYPLLIKHLLHSSMLHAADQEIVYRDQKRFTYRMLRDRIARLERAQGIGRAPRRYCRHDGLGHSPLPGSILRHPDDGRDPADGERASVA